MQQGKRGGVEKEVEKDERTKRGEERNKGRMKREDRGDHRVKRLKNRRREEEEWRKGK